MLRLVLFSVLWSIGAVAGCTNQPAVNLAAIASVSPEVLEPGDRLVIEGEGFVEGDARILLEGQFIPGGMNSAQEARVVIEGKALSQTRIEALIDSVTMGEITEEPVMFEGAVQVSFPNVMRDSALRIEARAAEIRIQFSPAGGGVARMAARDREGAQILARIGLYLSGDKAAEGLPVAQVTPGSVAARASIEPGARLVSVDRVVLTGVGDLSGLDSKKRHVFEFLRMDGSRQTLEAAIESTAFMPLDDFLSILFAALALAAFFTFVVKETAPGGRSPRSILSAGVAVAWALAGIPILLFPIVVLRLGVSAFAAIGLVVGLVTGVLVAAVFSSASIRLRILGVFVHLLPPLAVMTVGAMLSQSVDPIAVTATQEQIRFAWHVFDNPFMALATLLAIALLWPALFHGETPSLFATVFSWVLAVSSAMTIVVFALGGWPWDVLDMLPSALRLVAASLLFAIKTLGVLMVARLLARVDRSDRRRQNSTVGRSSLRAGLVIISSAAAVAWQLLNISPELRTAGVAAAAGLVFFTGFRLALTMIRRFSSAGVSRAE